jgi:hypothetical protein
MTTEAEEPPQPLAKEPQEDPKRKRESVPAAGYTCNICGEGGHWIQQCPQKKKKNKKTKASEHVPVVGVDPSTADIVKAREMQKIAPPLCPCGLVSRLSKVNQSKYKPASKAIGHYFFFCGKKRDDDSKCRFARPATEQQELLRSGVATPAHDDKRPICSFFVKQSCNKGDNCKFRHALA